MKAWGLFVMLPLVMLPLVMLPLLGAAAWCIAGGQAQAAPPASVDKTTPRTQQGVTLLAVSRGNAQGQYAFPVPAGMDFLSGPSGSGPAGGIGLWIRGFKPAAPYRPDAQPAAFARALNNDTLPVQIEPVSSSYNSGGSQAAPLYLVTLPGGYPSGYPAIDISVTNFHGHQARWRLINLAAPYHAIAPPVTLHSSFAAAGATLSIHAWRDSGYVSTGPGVSRFEPETVGVHYSITGKVPAGTHWVARVFKRQIEWEAVRPDELQALQAGYGPQYARRPFHRSALWTAAFGASATPLQNFSYPAQDMVPTPYGKYSRFLRVSGTLTQLATAAETVTFRNLNIHQSKPPLQYSGGRSTYTPPPSYEIGAKPQTVVTPSGLSFTLLPLSALGPQAGQFGGYGMPNSIRLLLRFGQALPGPFPYPQAALALPRSPLYKKYRKPVTYTLQAAKPYFLQPNYGGLPMQGSGPPREMIASLQLPFSPPVRVIKNNKVIYEPAPNTVPKHLDSLTLNVVQTAELKTIPFSFTAPIGTQPPAAPAAGHRFPLQR